MTSSRSGADPVTARRLRSRVIAARVGLALNVLLLGLVAGSSGAAVLALYQNYRPQVVLWLMVLPFAYIPRLLAWVLSPPYHGLHRKRWLS